MCCGTAAAQAGALSEQIDQARQQAAEASGKRRELGLGIAEDQARAEQLRQAQLEQLALEIRQCRLEREGLEQMLTVHAPMGGRVLFRAPAPQMAADPAPLLCVGPPEAFVARLRLPAGELEALRRAGQVVLELDAPAAHRRFVGRLRSHQPLPRDRGYVLAEVACEPPEEAIQSLAEGQKVHAALRWRGPLLGSPLCWLAAALVATGLLSWLASARPVRVASPGAGPDERAARDGQNLSLPDGGATHCGAEERVLQLLAHCLGEALVRGSVEEELLAAVEWALDRHQARAVRVMRECLADHEGAATAAGALLRESAATDGNGEPLRDGQARLRRICRTLLPEAAAGHPATPARHAENAFTAG